MAITIEQGRKIAALANKQFGKPYVWGAEGPDAFDCSGLVQYVYGLVGVQVPRVAADQWRAARPIPFEERLLGDLVFYGPHDAGGPSHVGIVNAPETVIEALNRETGVREAPVLYQPGEVRTFR